MKILLTLLFLVLYIGNGQAVNQEIYEAVSDVYVRGGIGTSSEIVGVLKAGEEVAVVDKTNPVWFKIETTSGSGYVSNKFLKFKEQLNSVPEISGDALSEVDNNTSGEGFGLAVMFFTIILILLFFVIESSRNKAKKKLVISLIENAKRELHNKREIPQPQYGISVSEPEADRLNRFPKTNNFEKRLEPEVDVVEKFFKPNKPEKGQESVPLRPVSNFLTKYPEYDTSPKVPFWTDKLIFSNSALETANEEQRRYYSQFKKKFLSGTYLDLKGNNNYAFALLYDLLDEYGEHENFNKLESQLLALGAHYSKVRSYAIGLLENIRREIKREANEVSATLESDSQPKLAIDSTGNPILDVTNDELAPFQLHGIANHPLAAVPHWPHQYIYSKSDLEDASPDQKAFYRHFRQKFLEGVCLPLEGNTNYAFILLFDLLQLFEEHKDFEKVEIQVNKLGNVYYKTRQYGIKFLDDIKRKTGAGFQVPETRFHYSEQSLPSQTIGYDSYPEYVYWKVGSKYKEKLGLSDQEVGWLNKLWESTNNFTSIEFCYIQTMRLYLEVLKEFKVTCAREETTPEEIFLLVSDMVARFQFRYRKGSSNYNMSLNTTSDLIYAQIFKRCENKLREYYGHKRKLNTDSLFQDPRITVELESKILNPISTILEALLKNVQEPDEATEVELNSLNTNRWKVEFDAICANFDGEPSSFLNAIIKLGELNRKNQSIENIFYEASKFIAPKHSESALILYLHYLHHDLKSVRFDNKPLTKTIQKSIFKSPEQVQQFESIVTEFLQDKSLDKAVKAVSSIYAVKRKKITLSKVTIEDVKQKHAGTVELLNEYLQEDEVDEILPTTELLPNSRELSFTITQEQSDVSTFHAEIAFKEIHFQTLEYFVKNNLSVAVSEFDEFAKNRGVFKNQLIDSINEACFDVLDDVLIEEEDEYYTIEPAYFQTISAK